MSVQDPDRIAPSAAQDRLLYAAHDVVNVAVFAVVFCLPYFVDAMPTPEYTTAKIIHLLGIGWFFGGLIAGTVCISRFIWTQPSLDHDKLAHGFRFVLRLELYCIPSIAVIAYGGMAMVTQLGGLEVQPWAEQGYLALLYSPIVLIITPRLYHKRLIKNPNVDIPRERRLAHLLDWSFIAVMTVGGGTLAASMVWKTALF